MTTVAYRDGIMACDSRLTGGAISSTPLKVIVGRRYLVGFCGTYASAYTGALYLAEESQNYPDTFPEDEGEFLISDGRQIWVADARLRQAPMGDKFSAIGSGGPAAMAAMYMGATAKEAVQIAIKVDECSGGPVRTFTLDSK